MIRKIPLFTTPVSAKNLWCGFKTFFSNKYKVEKFGLALSDYFGSKYCFTISSGKAAFYVILRALHHFSSKKEVHLPAHTDAGLILVIQSVGLKPILCIISLDPFNLDLDLLAHM